MATFTYESLKNKFLNPTVKGNLHLLDDGGILKIGDGSDLQITHSGSAGTIDNNTGNLELQVNASSVINLKDADGDTMAGFTSNGAVELYHNNTKRLETVAAGAKATGTFEVTGASTLTGAVTAAAGLTVDNLTLVNGGNEIEVAAGGLTLDVAGDIFLDTSGDIKLDAAGNDINLLANGTNHGRFSNTSNDFVIQSIVQDKNIIFKGNDGGSVITALTLDMSALGAATFNNDVTAFSDMRLKTDIKTIDNALSKVCDMRGVYFNRDGAAGTGVIAQEIQNILPEVVHDKQEYLSVAYGNIVGVLIEAIKELRNEVKSLKESK